MIVFAAAVLAAYLCGSIPFGLLLARALTGADLRRVGSGNIGATNALRAGGAALGVTTLVLDALKGAGGVFLARWIASLVGEPPLGVEAAIVAAPVLGHCFPVWLRFAGGKGVATAFGVIALASWPTLLTALIAFVVIVLPSRVVSLGSLAAASAAALGALWFHGLSGVSLGIVACAAVVVFRHRENISRLLRGEESRIGARRGNEESQR